MIENLFVKKLFYVTKLIRTIWQEKGGCILFQDPIKSLFLARVENAVFKNILKHRIK